jgi:anti-sigma factor RsiW
MNCEFGEKLVLYLYGEAGGALSAEVEGHLTGCAACRGELAALKAAEAAVSVRADGPSPWVMAGIMREARAGRARGFSFKWGEALLSGALASALAFVFSFSGAGVSPDLAWNSGLDSRLDSMEYSVYQAQADMNSPSKDWEYGISALEDETLAFSKNVKQG